MSKIVLLAINAKYVHSSLAVWSLAASIKKRHGAKHDVNVIEANINQNIADIAYSVTELEPDFVGISAYIWNAGILPELLKLLREQLPGVVIVLGGPEAVYNAQHWRDNGADFVLKGQNDQSVDPYTDEYFSALGDKLAYIETSRGCPYSCAFCLSADSSVEFFPLETVKERILKLSQTKTKTIKFVDRTFNCNPKRAYELYEYIIGLQSCKARLCTNCKFHFEVAADLFDDKTLNLLATAPPGKIQFEIGLQSFFEPALKASSRKTDLIKAEKNITKLLKTQNIHIHVDLIAGLPYETLDSFRESFDRAYRLGAHTLQLGFLKLLHGSKLRNEAQKLGIIYDKNPPYEIQSSTWLSALDIKILKNTENALQHTYNKNRFLKTIEYVLEVSGISPFKFYQTLGSKHPNYAMQLEDYVYHVYEFCKDLTGVDNEILCDKLHYDWLSMVKGKNLPAFLKNRKGRLNALRLTPCAICPVQCKSKVKTASCPPVHTLKRNEHAILSTGERIIVDTGSQNPVTGLYKVLIN